MVEVHTIRHPYLTLFVNSWVINTPNHSLLFDTGLFSGREKVASFVQGKPVILSTHGDWDHIGGHAHFQKKGAKVYLHPRDNRAMSDHAWLWKVYYEQFANDCVIPGERRVVFAEEIGEPVSADCPLEDGQELVFDDLLIRVIHTPGHTGGSVCFHIPDEGILITGDTLMGSGFFGGIPQYANPAEYAGTMEKLMQVDAKRIYVSHLEGAIGPKEFRQRLSDGLDCARRFADTVRTFLASEQAGCSTRLGDVSRHLAMSEGKQMGCAVNITALSYMPSLRNDFPLAASFAEMYELNT